MPGWREIADRAVHGLGVGAGEVIQIREHSGRFDVVLEMARAVERAGATPLPELTPPDYVERLLHEIGADVLATWDRHRIEWLRRVDRVLVLQGADLNLTTAPAPARNAWTGAIHRLVELENERRLPFLLVAVPTPERAEALSMPFDSLEARLLPALAVTVEELQRPIERALAHLRGGSVLTLRGADGFELRMSTVGRHWLADDGLIDADDRRRGGHVSNLPAGSVYSTVVEDSVEGQLRLPAAAGIDDVRLTFEGGRVTGVAGDGRRLFESLLMQHSGDPDRISHIGIGLNPYLREAIRWPLVDEHVEGAIFVALGENRYLGGQNESSLNVDFALPASSLLIDGKPIIEQGRLRP
jgi:leucyl aminopeptidase (aminopeptidase T)